MAATLTQYQVVALLSGAAIIVLGTKVLGGVPILTNSTNLGITTTALPREYTNNARLSNILSWTGGNKQARQTNNANTQVHISSGLAPRKTIETPYYPKIKLVNPNGPPPSKYMDLTVPPIMTGSHLNAPNRPLMTGVSERIVGVFVGSHVGRSGVVLPSYDTPLKNRSDVISTNQRSIGHFNNAKVVNSSKSLPTTLGQPLLAAHKMGKHLFAMA